MSLLIAAFCMLSFSSCGDDNDEPKHSTSTIVNGIDISLLPGYYYFSGNIAPSFSLFHDGTCETYSTGLSTVDDTGKWTYDKENKILLLMMDSSSNHTYTVKSLSDIAITMEWSSVKYGNYTSTWERTEIENYNIDASLLPGRYEGEDGNGAPYFFIIYEGLNNSGSCQLYAYRYEFAKSPLGSEADGKYDLSKLYNGTWKYSKLTNTLKIEVELLPEYQSSWGSTKRRSYEFKIKKIAKKNLEMELVSGNTDGFKWKRSMIFEIDKKLLPAKYYCMGKYNNTRFSLNANGQGGYCDSYWNITSPFNWSYDEETRQITINPKSGSQTQYKISLLTEGHLTMGDKVFSSYLSDTYIRTETE